MEKFTGYLIAVPLVMVLVMGLVRYIKGPEAVRMLGIFFLGWIFGAISMFIKAWIAYKR